MRKPSFRSINATGKMTAAGPHHRPKAIIGSSLTRAILMAGTIQRSTIPSGTRAAGTNDPIRTISIFTNGDTLRALPPRRRLPKDVRRVAIAPVRNRKLRIRGAQTAKF